jgi:hypothetical protein
MRREAPGDASTERRPIADTIRIEAIRTTRAAVVRGMSGGPETLRPTSTFLVANTHFGPASLWYRLEIGWIAREIRRSSAIRLLT